MEAELQEAVDQYSASLQELDALLQQDPRNDDVLQLKAELEEALAQTQDALASIQQASQSPDSSHQHQVTKSLDSDLQADAAGQPFAAAVGPQLPDWLQHDSALQPDTLPHASSTQPATMQQPGSGSVSTRHNGKAGAGLADDSLPAAPTAVSTSGRLRAAGSIGASNNARMHPRNRYADSEPDFAALAAKYPALRPYLTLRPDGSGYIDFRDLDASRELTKALLHQDFGISWDLPPGQLIPPVTNRANYIHWLEDLLALSAPPGSADVVGLDIGCGANAIYPLLGAALNGWRFVGVDITDVANEWAGRNVAANPHLAPLITIRRVPEAADQDGGLDRGVLLPAVEPSETFAFCMCNPPFFESIEEAGRNPSTAFSGTAAEMVCPGGELAFVSQMVRDSIQLGKRIHWYTSMVGKKMSLKALRKLLHSCHVTALRTTEFCQGRTSRWAIAWSFAVNPNLATKPLPRAQSVNPNLASKPLPRAQATAQAHPETVRRQVSYSLTGIPKAAVPKLLPSLEAVFSSRGCTCTCNAASSSMQVSVSFSSGSASAVQQDGSPGRQGSGDADEPMDSLSPPAKRAKQAAAQPQRHGQANVQLETEHAVTCQHYAITASVQPRDQNQFGLQAAIADDS